MTHPVRNPLRLAIEIGVLAPIGLLVTLQQQIPALKKRGDQVVNQVKMAKMIGTFAVQQVVRDADQHGRQQAASTAASVVVSNVSPVRVALESVKSDRIAPSSTPPEVAAMVGDARALPIEGYDNLAAAQIVSMLTSLTTAERALLRKYEQANRSRRTVLGKLDQLDSA